MEEFDIENFLKSEGMNKHKLQPFDYEKYKSINPKLTEEAYEICRRNGWEWKIMSGKAIYNFWTLIVPPVWYLDSGDDIENRNKYYRSIFEKEVEL